MQEAISFISIMLGVVILTAWVMWVVLRPSGDCKALRFARDAATGGALLPTDPRAAAAVLGRALEEWSGLPYGNLAEHAALRAEAQRLVQLRRALRPGGHTKLRSRLAGSRSALATHCAHQISAQGLVIRDAPADWPIRTGSTTKAVDRRHRQGHQSVVIVCG